MLFNSCGSLGADAVFGTFASSVMFNVFDDWLCDISASNAFNAETWRSVDFKDERSTTRTHKIDTSDMETHCFGGSNGDFAFFVS